MKINGHDRFIEDKKKSNVFDNNWEPKVSVSVTVSVDPCDMLKNFCFHVYAQKSLSHFHTLSLSHSRTITLSHSRILSFTLSRRAEQVLFSCLGSKVAVSCRKLQCFFLPQ